MASQHLPSSSPRFPWSSRRVLAIARLIWDRLVHAVIFAYLAGMDLENAFEPVLTMSELAATLRVSTQAIYDLRRTGRGPRAIRVGKELRFRRSEVEAWLVRMENEDAGRHHEERAS